MLRLYIGKNPKSHMYGKMIGFFRYQDGKTYKFTWHVHKPKQKYASLSNRMTDIEEILSSDDDGCMKHIETGFGNKAFWLHTPIDTLSNEDYDLRILMQNIKQWAVKEKLCKSFYKTDKLHTAWLS